MPLNLDDAIRFGFLIQDIARFRRVVIDRVLKPLGVTRSQWWVLTFLSRRDGLTQTALATDLELTKVAIGALLERMEATGLIERRAEDLDARMRRVYLTREGTRLIKQLRVQIKNFELEALEGVTDAELDTTFSSLRKMKKTLSRMLDEEATEATDAD
jgi:DNA-binding MarR family transcriptional regulator